MRSQINLTWNKHAMTSYVCMYVFRMVESRITFLLQHAKTNLHAMKKN
jgi:hypothetical protein